MRVARQGCFNTASISYDMKCLLFNITFLLSVLFVHAQTVLVAVSGGYESADLRWSIAGNGQSPDILSEVKWKGLGGPLADASVRVNLTKRFFVGGEVSKCFIKAGDATDTDYSEDNRQSPTYHAQLNADDGSLLAVRLYGGYNIFQRTKIRVAAFAGYTENKEFLFLLDHGQKNLRCTYNTGWDGVAGGVSGLFQLTSWFSVTSELQYSQMNYNAVADWNLIDAFQHPVSFRQQANGFDIKASITCVFKIKRYLSLFTSGVYHHAETGTGTDHLFLASGDTQTSQFNGAFTNARQLKIGALVQF
jgi:hypothetical protein